MAQAETIIAWALAIAICGGLGYFLYRLIRAALGRWRHLRRGRVAIEATALVLGLALWFAASRVVP
jgi:hypothetical protein